MITIESVVLQGEEGTTNTTSIPVSPDPAASTNATNNKTRSIAAAGNIRTPSSVDPPLKKKKMMKKPVLIKRFRPFQKGVLSGSLVGAERYYVDLAPPAPPQAGASSSEDSDFDEDDDSLSCSSSTTSPPHCRSSKIVQFAARCLVTDIPHHSEYSAPQRQQQWNGRKVIRRRARINTLEYQHDGWDMTRASEEESFVQVEGRWYHPVHQYTTSRFVLERRNEEPPQRE